MRQPCLPGRPEDVVATLAIERGRSCSITTVDVRGTSILYLHHLTGVPLPTA